MLQVEEKKEEASPSPPEERSGSNRRAAASLKRKNGGSGGRWLSYSSSRRYEAFWAHVARELTPAGSAASGGVSLLRPVDFISSVPVSTYEARKNERERQ